MANKLPTTFTQTPDKAPERQKRATIRTFKSIDSYFEYFDKIVMGTKRVNGSNTTYKKILENTVEWTEEYIRKNDISWLGDPIPKSFQEGLDRRRYQNMDDFNQVYKNNIAPRIQEILRNSSADLEVPVMKYNDLGLGTFDFNKASTGLVPLYKYYSFEMNDYVEGQIVETFKDGEKFKYRLITDGSPVALVPSVREDEDKKKVHEAYKDIYNGADPFDTLKKYGLKIGGQDAFSSTIKKSYVLKEKFPKPKNAVRIFFKIGENSNIRWPFYKWVGYAAIGIAELLDTLGYATNIIGVVGSNNRINFDGKLEDGTRYWGINLKRFEETLDKDSLLYISSDPSFFRIKMFETIVKEAYSYDDYLDTGLGSSARKPQLESMIFNEYGRRDKLFFESGKRNENSQFLYYILSDIYSEQDLNTAILDIGLDVVNKNKEARERIYGLMQSA